MKFNRFSRNFHKFRLIDLKICSEIEWNRQFVSWLKVKVVELHKHDDSEKIKDLLSLSHGPLPYVTCFKSYVTNGYRLHVQDHDKGLRTQNCGVVVVGEIEEDNKNIDYYGELIDILELQFTGGKRVILFRCVWFDVFDQERGIKTNEYGFVTINRKRFLKINEPFVLANQASQVFYVDDLANNGWHVVQKVQARDSFDVGEKEDDDLEELQGI